MIRSLLIGAALAASLATPAPASSIPSITGDWCLINEKSHEGWLWFRRGCEEPAVSLTLKRNGDYVLSVYERIERCKVQKVYLKGWSDYICTDRHGKKHKRFQKFVLDVAEIELGLTGE